MLVVSSAMMNSQNQLRQTGGSPSLSPSGNVWLSSYSIEECIYYITLAESQPIAIFVDEDKVTSLSGILRGLTTSPCIAITTKTQRQQASKLIRKSMKPNQGILILTQDTALFAQSCLPPGVLCKTLVHVALSAGYDHWKKRCSLLVQSLDDINSINIESLGKQISIVLQKDNHVHSIKTSSYAFGKQSMSAIQARVAAGRKLFVASEEASMLWKPSKKEFDDIDVHPCDHGGENDARRRALAGRIEGLRTKLKVLLSRPILGLPGETAQNARSVDSSNVIATGQSDVFRAGPPCESNKTLRSKLLVLGMVHEPGRIELEKQAASGRSLAVTRWMDGALADSLGCGWTSSMRYGASQDDSSLAAREIVEAFRDYVAVKAGRNLPTRENETVLQSSHLKKRLEYCRIVGFGWRPSSFGDDSWGGKFGKCCGHNEVAMFYARPWEPMEVLNTHVCSRKSPAPGNEGHDGCMEFLRAQCLYRRRAYSIWDDKFFHFIDHNGRISSLEKSSLLGKSETQLKIIVVNLRALTLECQGTRSPRELLETINLLLALANGELQVSHPLDNPRIARIVVSFLLPKSRVARRESDVRRK